MNSTPSQKWAAKLCLILKSQLKKETKVSTKCLGEVGVEKLKLVNVFTRIVFYIKGNNNKKQHITPLKKEKRSRKMQWNRQE